MTRLTWWILTKTILSSIKSRITISAGVIACFLNCVSPWGKHLSPTYLFTGSCSGEKEQHVLWPKAQWYYFISQMLTANVHRRMCCQQTTVVLCEHHDNYLCLFYYDMCIWCIAQGSTGTFATRFPSFCVHVKNSNMKAHNRNAFALVQDFIFFLQVERAVSLISLFGFLVTWCQIQMP